MLKNFPRFLENLLRFSENVRCFYWMLGDNNSHFRKPFYVLQIFLFCTSLARARARTLHFCTFCFHNLHKIRCSVLKYKVMRWY